MRDEYFHRKFILHGYNVNNAVLFRSFKVKDSLNRSISLYVTSVTWRWETPGRWGNPPVHIIAHFNLITFTSGGVTRRGLPHQPGVPHLNVNRPLDYFLKAQSNDSEHFPKYPVETTALQWFSQWGHPSCHNFSKKGTVTLDSTSFSTASLRWMKPANTLTRQTDIKGIANTNLCLLAKKRKLYEYNSILHQVPLESGKIGVYTALVGV